MSNEVFGRLVRVLRNQRHIVDEKTGLSREWTQEELARKTEGEGKTKFLTAKQIGDIERGRVSLLKPDIYIEPLARAFELTETEKREFYAVAGYVYRPHKPQIAGEKIRWLLEQSTFPGFAITPLWDYVADNKFAYTLYCQTDERIRIFNDGELGPNLLKILFDKRFDRKTLLGGEENWLNAVAMSVKAFRISSLRYAVTTRYQQIIKGMMQYKEFRTLWNTPSAAIGEEDVFLIEPTATVFHPEFGRMQFLTLLFPLEYIDQEVYVFTYVPQRESEANYQKLRETVGLNSVCFYNEQPLE